MDYSKIFNYWFLQTLAMLLTALLIPKLRVTSLLGAFITVVALGFVNATVWDAALFFSVPESVSLQALFLLVVNGMIFWVMVKLLPGIEVKGVLSALAAPVVFTICSLIIDRYAQGIEWLKIFESLLKGMSELRQYFISEKTQ